MLDTLFSFPIIILLLVSALLFLRREKSAMLYVNGIKDGVHTLYQMFPTLLLLCISVKLIGACGIIGNISRVISESKMAGYIDTELIPLILTRPISGSGSTAILSDLAKRLGTDSKAVLLAAIMISSSDTCIYIHSTYFSCISKKKNGGVLLLMLLLSLISAAVCIIISAIAF